jgi:hypothetical protein
MVHKVLQLAFVAAVPNPGLGVQPPGTGGLLTILRWLAYGVSLCCVGGILYVAGKMALQHQRGEAGQHMGALALVLLACVLAGAASAIVGALM